MSSIYWQTRYLDRCGAEHLDRFDTYEQAERHLNNIRQIKGTRQRSLQERVHGYYLLTYYRRGYRCVGTYDTDVQAAKALDEAILDSKTWRTHDHKLEYITY